MEKWENIDIINENQLPSHATMHYEKTLDLNGIWKIRCVIDPDTVTDDYTKEVCDLSDYSEVPVPSCIEPQGFSKPYYYGAVFPAAINTSKKKIPSIDHRKTWCALYRKDFTVSKIEEDSQYILRFDSVKSAFYCYLNENYVGMSKGSMLPCEFDVTKYLKEGNNLLSVRVHQFSDATYIEDQDMWFLSGIYRDVSLYCRRMDHLEDVRLYSELIDDYRNAILHCDVKTNAPGTVTVKIGGSEAQAEVIDHTASVSIRMEDARLWSAEKPELYDVEVIYENERQTFRFGFQEDRVDHEKALYLHNGKPIKIRGINYHAFTPDKGYYVSEEVYRKDLELMKKANINAIRTSHYPQADIFYDLCDEMGFYVMDECNVESHGVREKNVPGDDPRWEKHVTDRMERMVLRDRNHPCVSIWSLGNESACGKNHFRMKEKALSLDSSRPIHYEGGRNLELSDFLCDGYCTLDRERKFANKEDVKDEPTILQRMIPLLMSLNSVTYEEYRHHPIIVTEYQHAMGNAGSDVEEHIRIMDQCEQYCGGYVWDFKDKCLLKDGKLTYGGDWGVKDQGDHFCANGICDPFSVPHSIYYEIAHAFQPIVIEKTDADTLRIYNRNFFTLTGEYRSHYEVLKDGVCIGKKDLSTDVAPREVKEYKLGLDLPDEDCDLLLNVFFEKEDSSSYQQFVLRERQVPLIASSSRIKETETEYILNDTYVIDRKTGDLTQILSQNTDLLEAPLSPSFFRPYTDGDVSFIGLKMRRHKKLDRYAKDSIYGIRKSPEIVNDGKKITVLNRTKEYTLIREYEVFNEKLRVSASAIFHGKKVPNRFGMQMQVKKDLDTMTWFGKGPEDHYPGKDEGGMIGIYTQNVLDQDEYMRPQEHGNKTHVRFADISSKDVSLHIEKADRDLNVSFWPYTLKDLHEADHIFDLPEHKVTTVNIDCIQNGLNDCFVKCDPKYLIKTEQTYSFSFYLNVKAITE